MHTSRVFFGVWSGAAIILCRWGRWGRWGGDGWRQVPEQALPRAETFTTTCTNTILAPSTTQFPSPHPPPPPLPLITHHPPSTLHPPGAHLSAAVSARAASARQYK